MNVIHPTVSPHSTERFNAQGLNNPECKPSYAYMAITVLGKLAGATRRFQGAKVRAHAADKASGTKHHLCRTLGSQMPARTLCSCTKTWVMPFA